jgi:hypothetical protein
VKGLVDQNASSITCLTGSDGFGFIAYAALGGDPAPGQIKVAHCNNSSCSSFTLNTVTFCCSDSAEGIAISADGFPIVVIRKGSGVRTVKCGDLTCSSFTESILDTGGQESSAIAVAPDGTPLVVYNADNDTVDFVIRCFDSACNGGITTQIQDFGGAGFDSIAIGKDGMPLISSVFNVPGSGSDLRVVHCGDPYCSR